MFMFWVILLMVVGSLVLFLFVRYMGGKQKTSELVSQVQHDINKGNLLEAEQKLRSHLKEYPSNVSASLGLLKVYRESNKPAGMVKVCKDLLRLYEDGCREFDVTAIHNELAKVLWGLRKFEESFFHYVRCFKIDKTLPGLDNLAYALASQGHYREALNLLKECQEKNPKDMNIIRKMVPCHIGLHRPDDARNCLLDLFANSASQNKDNYLLGKLFYEMGDQDSAQNYFTDFLLNLDSKHGGEGQDCLPYIMPTLMNHSGNFSSREFDVWTRVLQNLMAHVYLSEVQKCEVYWHLGFMLLLKDPDNLNYDAARKQWDSIGNYRADYNQVKRLIVNLDNQISRSEWLDEFRNLRRQKFNEAFGNIAMHNIKASEMFEIPPFSSNVVEEWLNPATYNGSKHVFKSSPAEFYFRRIESMPPKQFKGVIQSYLESQKFTVRREIVLDGSGTSLYLLCTSRNGESVFWAFHRSSGDTGEVELKNVIDQKNECKADLAKVVSLGSYTDAAVTLANKKGVDLMSVKELKISWDSN